MNAIVAEARLAERPVAAHTGETSTALTAARAGVATVEHVFLDTHDKMDELIEEMKKNGTIWVPTLDTSEKERSSDQFAGCKESVERAYDAGVRVAAGGDTGVFSHGLNAREVEILIEAGIPAVDVLECCTVGGWEACGGDQSGFRFGWVEEGARADIIALETDPREDRKVLRKVDFVMKDEHVYKEDGQPVNVFCAPEWPEEKDDDFNEDWQELSKLFAKMAMSVPSPIRPHTREPSPHSSYGQRS